MKNEKGITLIALLITIIVMLILVAVTVAIAVNGGIFRNAKDASVETEKKSLYETIVSAMRISNDGDILIKETAVGAKATIEEDKTKDNGIDRPTTIEYDDNTNPTYAILTVEGNTGTYMYKITSSAILFYNGEDTGENNGGGSSPQIVDNLIPSDEQLPDAINTSQDDVSRYTFAGDPSRADDGIYYSEFEFDTNIKTVEIDYNGLNYMFFCDEYTRNWYYNTLEIDMDALQWYVDDGNGAIEYNGPCPITLSTFNEVNNEPYVTRVINSFGS